jgi:hypothetical protein
LENTQNVGWSTSCDQIRDLLTQGEETLGDENPDTLLQEPLLSRQASSLREPLLKSHEI